MKRLIGIFISVFAVFLMSHNASAAQRVGNYSNYATNFSGLPTSIVNNRMYTITGNANNLYLANGQFAYGINWQEGKTYHLSIVVSADGSGIYYVVPEAIHIDGDNYKSTNDNISSSVDCSSSTTCRYTVIHNIDIVATATGSEVVKTPTSNILNLASNGQYSGSFEMACMLFDDEDEWSEWRDSITNKLNDISNNTGNSVDVLNDIKNKLDQLDTNADKDAEAWNNMQHTDGLVDTGDTTQLLSIVGVITTVFDQIKNAPISESCIISTGNNPINLGDINLCHTLPSWASEIGNFVMTTISFVAVLFMLIGCVNAINNYMDWLRRN